MMDLAPHGSEVVDAIARRSDRLLERLAALSADDLQRESALPGWSRVTVVCHLRYGAVALQRMTTDTLSGREASFYPLGRERQRPDTLVLAPGERIEGLVGSAAGASQTLTDRWSELTVREWATPIREPRGNPDLGAPTLAELALLRLTEVEVHGVDLDVGISIRDWSPELVGLGFPHRLSLLAERRRRHPGVDRSVSGRWRLRCTDGGAYVVTVNRVEARFEEDDSLPADASITGTMAELLAFLLGRLTAEDLEVEGDGALARAFKQAFPGP
jgi:uncharacterized protein (TIGR03083 family)